MAQPYTYIPYKTAAGLKLIMADVDGTLIDSGNDIDGKVIEAVHLLEEHGILCGLVSGRTVRMLEEVAGILSCHGPIIAENGGVARLKPGGEFLDLSYSRKAALDTLAELKKQFPGRIVERYDNSERSIDIVFRPQDVSVEELHRFLGESQLLDSGYICHLMQKGISKGVTLSRILVEIGSGKITPAEVMVFGDSPTDLSLFQMFGHNVLIPNYRIDEDAKSLLINSASYVSSSQAGAGFAEAAFHILNMLQYRHSL